LRPRWIDVPIFADQDDCIRAELFAARGGRGLHKLVRRAFFFFFGLPSCYSNGLYGCPLQ
jgi:hypothetical protein